MSYIFNSVLVVLVLDAAADSNKYCSLCKEGTHTICYFQEGPSNKCLDYKKPDFTDGVKKYILDLHNDIRNHIASGHEAKGALNRQPSAADMNTLQWDNELAYIAQRWADQCVGLTEDIQHDKCRRTSRFEVGQNILTAVTLSSDFPEIAILILNWYQQVENVLPSDIDNFSGVERGKYLIGHYTQLVWAETRFVGCGMSSYRNKNCTDPNSKYLHRLVCNYGPRGNVIGSPVYNRGVPCSKCLMGTCDPVRTSLCQEPSSSDSLSENNGQLPLFRNNNPVAHVAMPISLFNTLSLGYILKYNFDDFINEELHRVEVHLGPYENISHWNQTEQLNWRQQDNLNKYVKVLKDTFIGNDLRKPLNLMHQYDNHILKNILYELENGEIIVDDCRHVPHLCQIENDEPAVSMPQSEEIVLPNKMVYKKVEGIWFHGKCRCNYVYRSRGNYLKSPIKIEIKLIIMTYGILTAS